MELHAATRVRSRVWSSRICGGQSGAGAGFPRVLRFPLPIFIPPIAPQSPSPIIGAGTIGQKWSQYKALSPTPLSIKKIVENKASGEYIASNFRVEKWAKGRNQREGGSKLVFYLAHSLTLRMEAIYSPENSIDSQRATHYNIVTCEELAWLVIMGSGFIATSIQS
jgi:hypothetical protein